MIMVELFFDFQRKKNIRRFGICPPVFHESVAAHCGAMMDMADEFIESYDLGLDYRRVMQLIKYHDICELGMAEDYNSTMSRIDTEYKAKKQDAEKQTIYCLTRKHGKRIADYDAEYDNQTTREAVFVKFLDKLDSVLWQLNAGVQNYRDMDLPPKLTFEEIYDEIATKTNKFIKEFPQLNAFYRKVQEAIKAEYDKHGIEWKEWYWAGQCL